MFEIIKKANRFCDDEPEVIDHADSLSEAEALAHDYQVNRYGPSAFVTVRRAGERTPEESAQDTDFRIAYHEMTIEGLPAHRFLVAKVRRVSSPPVQQGTVGDRTTSALGRLTDTIRMGRESRSYADLKAAEWSLAPTYMESAEAEWAEYERVICQVLGVERLEPFPLKTPQWLGKEPAPDIRVTYHDAEMSEKPYLIARVGQIFGSPAPILLLRPHEQKESAFFRLFDQFRSGENGRCYKDFVESRRKQGTAEADIRAEWLACEQAVLSERFRPAGGN
jgi:hypothetical protein